MNVHCWRHGGHGTLRLHDAIKKSCDVFFYETARRLGIDRLAACLAASASGSLVGIDIPGSGRAHSEPGMEAATTRKHPGNKARTVIPGIGQESVCFLIRCTRDQRRTPRHRRAITPRLVRGEGVDAARRRHCPARFPVAGFDPASPCARRRRHRCGRQRAGRHRLCRAGSQNPASRWRRAGDLASPRISQQRRGRGLRKAGDIREGAG